MSPTSVRSPLFRDVQRNCYVEDDEEMDLGDFVLELDAAYRDSSLDSPNESDSSQELTYVDIDTFLPSF